MEEIKELTVVGYKATDGTKFKSQEECRKYEDSAKGVLMAKYAKYLVKKTTECEIFSCGSDDMESLDLYEVTPESIDVLRQILILERYPNTPGNNAKLDSIDPAGVDFLLIYRGYERDSFYIMGSVESYIQKLRDLKQELCD